MTVLSTDISEGSPSILLVRGEVDIATAEQFRFALKRALADDPAVIVDMGEVSFIDLAGVRVILEAASSCNGHGPLKLVHARRVAWLLELIGLEPETVALDLGDQGDRHGR